MEQWTDQGIVLSARAHGEGGAVVALLTEEHGRHGGYVHGGMSSSKRGMLQIGSQVKAQWSARVSDSLGAYTLESEQGLSINILDDSLRLSALQSACGLCDASLPEREGHGGLYHGFLALLEMLADESLGDHWGVAYVMWEISLLRELGFHLELDKCAGGGDAGTLSYVSPKTGRSVSKAEREIYKEKLLALPNFLRPASAREGDIDPHEDILTGLKMTGYFLEHWAFIHHSNGLPEARTMFAERYGNNLLTPIF